MNSRVLFVEAIGTSALVSAILGAALVSDSGGFGVAITIGFTVMAMAYAVGPISGGHFNPAVSFGLFSRSEERRVGKEC